MDDDQYLGISGRAEGFFKEKGSRFIALAYPVSSVDEAKEILGQIRKEYHDARHHCYAYKIGKDNPEQRYSDDGEPSGTAGKPIYGQIESFGLTNVLIVVVRYFGGIKLGTGGLIQAYRAAARDALNSAETVITTVTRSVAVHFPYLMLNDVMRIIKEEGLKISRKEFSEQGEIVLSVRAGRFEAVRQKFLELPGVGIGTAG